ncbi:MAG: asparagine synthase (glutamine-hydrolyzing) [Leptolyngbyaceae cyanobacterium]
MCGLIAYLTAEYLAPSVIDQALSTIAHRGPNGEGQVWLYGDGTSPTVMRRTNPLDQGKALYRLVSGDQNSQSVIDQKLILGHRRLSILDLSQAGHQPMSDRTQRYWVVYNGEIYNYLELRAELETLGHQFLSSCDTEVLIAAFAQWGEACLNRFNGMFAFLIYDRKTQRLFAARDRFGIKPLYYWVSPNHSIAFASEIKQFTRLPGWQARMNEQQIYDFLVWSITDHSQETCFDGVYQLRPGECLTVDCQAYWHGQRFSADKALAPRRWYDLTLSPSTMDLKAASEKIHYLLQDAVELRLIADVPIGSCLSGGLDSSSIVCLIDQLKRQQNQQKTFTACAHASQFDERHWAEKVASIANIEPHYLYPDLDNLWTILPDIVWHQDEPFGSTSVYAQWSVFQTARQADVTVMLDGQGADEQFCGYHFYFKTLLQEHLRQKRFAHFWQELNAIKQRHGMSRRKQLSSTTISFLPDDFQSWGRKVSNRMDINLAWLNPSEQSISRDYPQYRNDSCNNIRDTTKQHLFATSLQRLLRWEDRNSMAHSIEARVPFVDHRLIELVYGLPTSYKIGQGETKRILRSAMADIIPKDIAQRQDKMGFATPEEMWLKQSPEKFTELVERSIELSQGILNENALEVTIGMIREQLPFSFLPWRFLSFGAWVEAFDVTR